MNIVVLENNSPLAELLYKLRRKWWRPLKSMCM